MDKSTSSGFGLLGSQRFGPTAWVCSLVHTVLHGLNCLGLFNPIRRYAMRRCLSSILEYRDKSEGYRDSLSPLHGATFALILEGYSLHSEPVRRELQALEHFMLSAERGKEARIGAASLQDTSLMLGSLCDAGMRADTHRLKTSLEWLCDQLADLRSITSTTEPFNGYLATSYPDITGTAAAVVALIRQEPLFVHSTSILDALEWLLTKQNADGGWGVSSGQSSDRFLLENMCFGDMECLYDRSCPESSGHVLEAFGLFLAVGGPHKTRGENKGLLNRLALASQRAIYYLSMTQEPSGAWPGRRGRSHIYGTCAVLCGLAYFIGIKEGDRWSERDDAIFDDVHEAITWLKAIQRKDGSWGETPCTYSDSLPSGCDTASPSETAWALLALLPYVDPSTSVIIEGVKYLLKTQRKAGSHGATWIDEKYDGKPNNPSACHPLHSHYYPMMALGRFAHVSKSLLLGQHTDCSVAR
ncbi:terpenoid cyclases/protein prenyltransferase alpha-alpha toroid [Aspergillus floccosus]